MSAIKYKLIKIISFMLIATIFMFNPVSSNEKYTVTDEENIKLKITLFSDCHLETNNFDTMKHFCRMLQDAKNCEVKDDVTVFLGDDTMNGQLLEGALFYGIIDKSGLEGPFVNALGNHDVGNEKSDKDYDTLYSRFQGYNKEYLGLDLDKPYYKKTINGYDFIVLATEEVCCHDPIYSNEQVEWFAKTLAESAESGKPVFVCSHHDVIYEDEIFDIMNQYKNIFCLVGHSHMPLSYYTYRQFGNVSRISVPRSTDVEKGEPQYSGIGFQIEVYDDEVLVRARDYYDGQWIEDYVSSYDLTL